MKKSIIITIALIYIASVVFIGFFGMKIMSYNETLYVEQIVCINSEAQQREGYKSIIINFEPIIEGEQNPNVVQLEWRVFPEDATYRNVSFEYNQQTTVGYVTPIGTVVFDKKGTITINITSTDGRNIRETVRVIAI